jgi:hypothetical protein
LSILCSYPDLIVRESRLAYSDVEVERTAYPHVPSYDTVSDDASTGFMCDVSKVQAPEVSVSFPVTGSSARTIGQPSGGSAAQSPFVVKYFA